MKSVDAVASRLCRVFALQAILLCLSFSHLSAADRPSSGPQEMKIDGGANAKVLFWLETSLHRVYPATKPGSTNLSLLAARNSKIAFQACFRGERLAPINV